MIGNPDFQREAIPRSWKLTLQLLPRELGHHTLLPFTLSGPFEHLERSFHSSAGSVQNQNLVLNLQHCLRALPALDRGTIGSLATKLEQLL